MVPPVAGTLSAVVPPEAGVLPAVVPAVVLPAVGLLPAVVPPAAGLLPAVAGLLTPAAGRTCGQSFDRNASVQVRLLSAKDNRFNWAVTGDWHTSTTLHCTVL